MSKEQDRLLTDEEMLQPIWDMGIALEKEGRMIKQIDRFRTIAQTQRTLTREATCKEIGEWLLERVMCEHLAYYHRRFTCEKCVEALKQGELPQQGEKG